MIELVEQYLPQIITVLAIVSPLIPTMITNVISSNKLRKTFDTLTEGANLKVDVFKRLSERLGNVDGELASLRDALNININEVKLSVTSNVSKILDDVQKTKDDLGLILSDLNKIVPRLKSDILTAVRQETTVKLDILANHLKLLQEKIDLRNRGE